MHKKLKYKLTRCSYHHKHLYDVKEIFKFDIYHPLEALQLIKKYCQVNHETIAVLVNGWSCPEDLKIKSGQWKNWESAERR